MIHHSRTITYWRRIAWLMGLLLFCGLIGCTKKGDSIVLAGDGTRLSSEEIDRDPLALLPAGAIGLIHLDARAAFQSSIAPAARKMIQTVMPLGAEANFDPGRDVHRVIMGLYSMQGADMVMIVQASLDPEAIKNAASMGRTNALGTSLTRLEYANNDLYVAGEIGFVVVTRNTMVVGNETGIRRTLDRIRDKRIRREIPEWMAEPIDNPQASLVGVADLSTDPMVLGLTQQAPFLDGLSVIRMLGNFESPGLNLAGSFTYPDDEKAKSAAASLEQLGQLASFVRLISLLGIPSPIQSLQTRQVQHDVQFTAAINAQGVSVLFDWLTAAQR